MASSATGAFRAGRRRSATGTVYAAGPASANGSFGEKRPGSPCPSAMDRVYLVSQLAFRHPFLLPEGAMYDQNQDCYLVFVRDESGSVRLEDIEQPVAACATYADAVRVGRQLRGAGNRCVIRS